MVSSLHKVRQSAKNNFILESANSDIFELYIMYIL